jgi:hypothetical protein
MFYLIGVHTFLLGEVVGVQFFEASFPFLLSSDHQALCVLLLFELLSLLLFLFSFLTLQEMDESDAFCNGLQTIICVSERCIFIVLVKNNEDFLLLFSLLWFVVKILPFQSNVACDCFDVLMKYASFAI